MCQEDENRVMTSKPAFEICKSPENEGKFSNKYGNLLNCMYVCTLLEATVLHVLTHAGKF